MEKNCEFGCGQIAHYQLKNGKWCCSSNCAKCPSIKKKNSEGLKKAHKEGRVPNFSNKAREKSRESNALNRHRDFLETPDKPKSSEIIRWNLNYSGRPYKCEVCDISEWQGQLLTLEVDHIDGNHNNNRLENLRYLCPNCHSQTETYKGRNINKGFKSISDEELLEALKETSNVRRALLKVGLAASGGNYERALKLKERFSL